MLSCKYLDVSRICYFLRGGFFFSFSFMFFCWTCFVFFFFSLVYTRVPLTS